MPTGIVLASESYALIVVCYLANIFLSTGKYIFEYRQNIFLSTGKILFEYRQMKSK